MKQILDQTTILKLLNLPYENDEKSMKLQVRKKLVEALSNFDYFKADSSQDQIEILFQLANQANIGIISKDSYLFHQGDICNSVYVLLDGSVEIIEENSLIYQEDSQLIGQELTGLNILGQVSLIESLRNKNQPSNDPIKRRKGSIGNNDNQQQDQLRSYSVRSLEQSVLCQLSISTLNNVLSSKISSRQFLSSIFSTFHVNIPEDLFFQTQYFNRHCRQLKFQVGDHIIQQDTLDDGYIYVVFQGQCALQKTVFKVQFNNDIDMLRSQNSNPKQKTITLLEITSGVIFGIESDNIFNSPDQKRLVSVVCSQHDTIVFQISKSMFHGEEYSYGREALQKMASLKLKRIIQLIKFDFRRISKKRGKGDRQQQQQKTQQVHSKEQNQSQSPDKSSFQQHRSIKLQIRPKSMTSMIVLPENGHSQKTKILIQKSNHDIKTRQSHEKTNSKLRNSQKQYMEEQLEGVKRKYSQGITKSTCSSERASSAVKERKDSINHLFSGSTLKTRPSMSSLLADIQVMSRHTSAGQSLTQLNSNQILFSAPHTINYPSSSQLNSFHTKISNHPSMSLNSFPDNPHSNSNLQERIPQQLPQSSSLSQSSQSCRSSFSLRPKTERTLSFCSSNKVLRNNLIFQPFGALLQQKQKYSHPKQNIDPYLIHDTFQPIEMVPSSRVRSVNLNLMHPSLKRRDPSNNGLSQRITQNGVSPLKQNVIL